MVISPIGDQAPPALHASINIPPKNQMSFLFFINLGNIADMTIAVVKLSNTADKKKPKKDKIQSSLILDLVVILSVIIEKP